MIQVIPEVGLGLQSKLFSTIWYQKKQTAIQRALEQECLGGFTVINSSYNEIRVECWPGVLTQTIKMPKEVYDD